MRSVVEISDAGKIAAIQEILKQMHITENQFFEQATNFFIEECTSELLADKIDGEEALRRLALGEPKISWTEAKTTLGLDD